MASLRVREPSDLYSHSFLRFEMFDPACMLFLGGQGFGPGHEAGVVFILRNTRAETLPVRHVIWNRNWDLPPLPPPLLFSK